MQTRIVSLLATTAVLLGSQTVLAQGAPPAEPAAEEGAAEEAPAEGDGGEEAAGDAAEEPAADPPAEDGAAAGAAGATAEASADAEGAEAEAAPAEGGEKEGFSDEEAADVADARAGEGPVEAAGETYYFVGARYRAIVVPKFMINLFADGGTDVIVHGVGPEFAIRKDGFEYNLSIWWAGYNMDETPFKSSSDGEKAWEIVKSELNVIYATADFLWSQEFSPSFSLNYGGALGLGFVFGDLFRNQAYPEDGGPVNASNPKLEKCPGPTSDDPNDPFNGYCGTDNDHYGNFTEANWADGGSTPIVFPWLAIQTGLRFKPSKRFVARLDLGFGTSGFFAGLGLDYGL